MEETERDGKMNWTLTFSDASPPTLGSSVGPSNGSQRRKIQTHGPPRRFTEWAADNAALLDREYEDGIRKLALAIVNWNFPGETGTEWPADIIVLPDK